MRQRRPRVSTQRVIGSVSMGRLRRLLARGAHYANDWHFRLKQEATPPTRTLERGAARSLPAGAEHYSAYVGPPRQYDFMGATQFRLLTALGLRENHRILDYGCGSLRAGRLLIPYLMPGNYHGLEPNQWLINDSINHQLGADMIKIKRPQFYHNDDFQADKCGNNYDFIIAQSIFSHMGTDLITIALNSFHKAISHNGLILITFVQEEHIHNNGSTGWI